MNKAAHRQKNRTVVRLTVTFFVCMLSFAVLASFVAKGLTLAFDSSVLVWINSKASQTYDSLFIVITELGGVYVVATTTLALFLYFLRKKFYAKAILVALGVGGAAAIGYMLKALFERTRPDLWEWIITETNFSFPSGHAIGCSALALCVVALLWNTKWRYYAVVGAVIYVFVISFSRLYLGVHYPSDIIGGWLLSSAWVALLTSLIHLYQLDNLTKRGAL